MDLGTFNDRYKVRTVEPADRPLVESWIAQDPDHVGRGVTADFFLVEEPGVGCYALLDRGDPVFFFRTSNVVRLDVQFGPILCKEERERLREALVAGTDWFAGVCALRGATEIVFETQQRLLAAFAKAQMGFTPSPHEMVRSLDMERCAVELAEEGGHDVRS